MLRDKSGEFTCLEQVAYFEICAVQIISYRELFTGEHILQKARMK